MIEYMWREYNSTEGFVEFEDWGDGCDWFNGENHIFSTDSEIETFLFDKSLTAYIDEVYNYSGTLVVCLVNSNDGCTNIDAELISTIVKMNKRGIQDKSRATRW